ncbi:MAG: UDP-3-O-[3-hydroxymyristoyl] N-acetylglucosamine deacetylase [Alphaproteobacteria bacterium]|nr:MAG: UDP-3-O-[3-hydroxymyristoyl] N-acetylglucosamine deacetylase [Alphaproteobacteria bacterium]
MDLRDDVCVTLAKEVSISGIGLHSGVGTEVVLRPHAQGGVVFRRNGMDYAVRADMVQMSPLCTLVELDDGVTLSTVEHLLSALHGLRVDGVLVEINGPEVPILDGSALQWVELIDKAGRMEVHGRERNWLKVAKPVVADMEGRVLLANPDARLGVRVECNIDFPHPAIGKQVWKGVVDEQVFRREIAPARTFVQEKDIAAAQAAGLAKGGSLENAVVFGENGGVLNKEGLRFADEPVRHKVLDLIGDIYMQGRCVSGAFAVTAPGHVANNQLLRKIVAVENT